MADTSLIRSSQNNGTVTPATPGSITAGAGDLLICIIAATGTSPTIATPTGGGTWQSIQNVSGATLSFGMFFLPNNAGGAINPSSVLGGTITGWLCIILEYTQTGANCGLQGSAQSAQSTASIPNILPLAGQTLPNELFVYSVGRVATTFNNLSSSFSPNSPWSSSVQSFANVQTLSLDTYWLSTLGQGAAQYPSANGTLGAANASVQIAAWVNTTSSLPRIYDATNVAGSTTGGSRGVYVGPNYSGMIGG